MNRAPQPVIVIGACWFGYAAAVGATVGGSDIASILGWNPNEKKLYYVVTSCDESCRRQVYALDLGSSHPDQPVPVWPEDPEGRVDHRAVFKRIEALRKELVQLPVPVPDAIDLTVITKAVAEFDIAGDRVPEFHLELAVSQGPLKGQAAVTAYCNRMVTIHEWYRIPQLPYAVVNVSYTGKPEETCYCTPAVLLLRGDAAEPTAQRTVPSAQGCFTSGGDGGRLLGDSGGFEDAL
jgi:hypothetical protein